jgi:hypothetical protein
MATYASTGNTVGYETLDFRSINYRITNLDSMNNFKQKYLSQRWAFKLKSPPVLRSEAFQVLAGFTASKSRGTTTLVPPVIASTSGTASGTVTAQLISSTTPSYNYVKGSTNIAVSGGSGTLKKGDMIKFSNHTKVYMLTADVNLDGSTIDTLSIFPALFTDLTAGATITYNNVPFTVSYESDLFEIRTDQNGYYTYELDYKEEY